MMFVILRTEKYLGATGFTTCLALIFLIINHDTSTIFSENGTRPSRLAFMSLDLNLH